VPIRVLIADASASMRSRLQDSLRCSSKIRVVGEATAGDEALRECLSLKPDVLILDMIHPNSNGIRIVDEIRRAGLPTRVIASLDAKSPRWIQWAAEAGATGYVFREGDLAELAATVEAVHAGELQFPASLAAGLAAETQTRAAATRGHEVLTERENEVLGLIALGRTSKDIAGELHISARTVDAHRANIMKKLRVHSVAELVRWKIDRPHES